MDKKMNVLDNLRELCGEVGIWLIPLYIFYFLIVSFHTVSVFEKFIFNAINPPISVPFLTALLLFSSCYGAYKGIEAISRASGLIFVFTVFAMIFFLILRLKRFSQTAEKLTNALAFRTNALWLQARAVTGSMRRKHISLYISI